jgi:hypothetical protein
MSRTFTLDLDFRLGAAMVSRVSGFVRGLMKTPALAAIAVAMTASAASAETLLMPTRDARTTAPVVVWGVTTQVQGPRLTLFA